ncbi:TPA: LacI family transcriptional regulator, partial [Candidatus Bipolaricaulota bacterium]|nr:LacI family transcriptional regulator [Candidatus Bipolaricaulota bacterium]
MGVRKKVTIREVAARAGVSVSTVSRVLNGRDAKHMRPETKARVLQAIEELEYTPVKAARSLRRQRTQVIGILLPDISNPFFSLLARGVASVAFESGYSTLICDSDHSVEKESRYLDILLAEGVEGIVFVPVGRPDMGRVQRLLRRGIKIVAADRRVEGLPGVWADNRGGSRELTRYVLNLGYRKICYIAGPEEVSSARERLAGFLDAVEEERTSPVAV